MQEIKRFDKVVCKKLSAEVIKAIQDIGKKYNVDIAPAGGTFSDPEYKMKIKFNVIDSSGKSISKEAEDFKQYAGMFGLNPEHLGAKFFSGGDEFEITGLKTRNRKLPIIATQVKTGVSYKFREDFIKRALTA